MPLLRMVLAAAAGSVGLMLAVPIVLLGLPFFAVSTCVRFLVPRFEPACIRWPDIFMFDADLGWKAKENLDCYCLEERDDVFHIRTDGDGWPGTRSITNSDLVVFGDSHAFSYGVDHDKSFPELIPDLHVKAIGAPGYNMVQELLLIECLAPQLRGKLVVWFCYIGNDLYDNLSPEMLGYRCPFIRQSRDTGEWEIMTTHLSPDSWTCSKGAQTLRKGRYPLVEGLHTDTALSQRAYQACEVLIRQGQQVCSKEGARLVVMSIPSPFTLDAEQLGRARDTYQFLHGLDADYPDHRLREICTRSGVSFVPLKDYLDLDDYKPLHDHWTERGHRRVAKALHDVHREHAVATPANEQLKVMLPEPQCAL